MRAFAAIPIVLMGLGCQSCPRLPLCDADPASSCCESPCPTPRCEPPKPCPPVVQAPPPRVEVKPPEEIRVKAPPQRVVVNTPAPAPAAVPAVPQAAPMMMQPAAAQVSLVSATIQSAPSARAIPAIGIDWIRIPFPVLRLFAVPTVQEVSVPITQTQLVPVQSFAGQAAFPAAVPQIPVPAPAVVPQAAMAVPVAVPGAAVAQPVASPVVAVPAAAPTRECPPQTQASKENLHELMKQVQTLENELKDRLKQAGENVPCRPER